VKNKINKKKHSARILRPSQQFMMMFNQAVYMAVKVGKKCPQLSFECRNYFLMSRNFFSMCRNFSQVAATFGRVQVS